MYRSQGGVCAVCNQPERARTVTGKHVRRLSLDHDHESNMARALLCSSCNAALGYIQDNLTIARSLVRYLEKHKPINGDTGRVLRITG